MLANMFTYSVPYMVTIILLVYFKLKAIGLTQKINIFRFSSLSTSSNPNQRQMLNLRKWANNSISSQAADFNTSSSLMPATEAYFFGFYIMSY
jgi:hypothetical protein